MRRFIFRIRYIILAILFLAAAIVSGIFMYYYIFNPDVSSNYSILFLTISLISVVITTACIFLYISSKKSEKIKDLDLKLQKWTNISYHVSEAGDEAFNKLPIGIVIYNNYDQIAWANNYAKEVFGDLLEQPLSTISKELDTAVSEGVLDLTLPYRC